MLKSKKFLIVILIVVLSGCNPNSNSTKNNKKTFFPTQNQSLVTQQHVATISMEARIEGILKKDENGCLKIGDDLLIWPYGATLQDDIVYDKDGNIIAVLGESVAFGGGGLSTNEGASIEDLKKISNQLPNNQCDTNSYFIVQSID